MTNVGSNVSTTIRWGTLEAKDCSDDLDQISEMIGNILEVEEIDEAGQAWVTMWWGSDDGEADAHGIGLAPSEMELVAGDGMANSVAETD